MAIPPPPPPPPPPQNKSRANPIPLLKYDYKRLKKKKKRKKKKEKKHPPPPIFSERKCPVCGTVSSKELFRQEFAKIQGVSFLDGYNVVSCEQCGFVYASNIPEQADFDAYYINANKYEHEIEQPDIITGRYEHIIQEIIRFNTDKTASIVDIGCARSEILRSLKNIGFSNLTGIDPSAKNIEYLKSKGINGIHSTIKNIDTSKQYEIVFFLAVLEHIQDLRLTVDTLYSATDQNGITIIAVPDMTAAASSELPYQEFSREHINYFTEVSLSNLMMQHGFYVIFLKKERGELIGFFRKQSKTIQKDISGEQYIQHYIAQSKKYEDEIYANLLPYSDVPVIVWGLGTFTQRFLAKNILKNITALVDSNPQYAGKKYGDICVISPQELAKYKEPILLAVSLRYIDAIIHAIKDDLKLENEIIRIHIYNSFEYRLQ
jgi:2-polyprenyl-3-methyl-5-hydroxy-6-metoxy-1,4-benzoquinol methylase